MRSELMRRIAQWLDGDRASVPLAPEKEAADGARVGAAPTGELPGGGGGESTPIEGVRRTHRYAERLAERAAVRPDGRIAVKLRTLLGGFGYRRRTDRVVAEVTAYLAASNLVFDVAPSELESLDQKVTIRTTAPLVALVPGATGLPTTRRRGAAGTDDELVEVAEHAVAATVTVQAGDGLGSGFLVHPDGLVVTGRHVVADEHGRSRRTVKVLLSDNREVEGVVFRSHRALDFALLWLRADGPFPALRIGNPRALRHAETVLAVGSPYGLRNTVSRGVVSNPGQVYQGVEWIQTDASIDHGNSGGPLLNGHGEAVGINLWGRGNLDSGKFAVPLDYLEADIRQAVQDGRERSLEATYCTACGFTDPAPATWYCRNCGLRTAAPPPAT